MLALLLVGAAIGGSVGPAASLGGPRCTLDAPRVIAPAAKPAGPFGVTLGLAPTGGALAWQADDTDVITVHPVGPHGEPRQGAPAVLSFRISHFTALQPVEGGFLLVGWGFSDLCERDCVVAQALDAAVQPVGAPAVWSADTWLDFVASAVEAGPQGVVFVGSKGGSGPAVVMSASRAPDGAAVLTGVTLPVTTSAAGALVGVEGGERVVVLRPTPTEVVVVQGAQVGPRVAAPGRVGPLTHEADGWWLWAPAGGSEDAPVPPTRRHVEADGTLGEPVTVGAAELPLTFGRVDIGSSFGAHDERVEGLLFSRRDGLSRYRRDDLSLAAMRDARLARTVVAAEGRWVAAWVGLEAAGWQVMTRTARCPGG